jgi:Rha family phage regulatory protein
MELVELKRNEIYCDTGIIARKFGMQHAKVVQAMETLIPKLDDFRVKGFHSKVQGINPRYLVEQRTYRGKDYTAYLLNRDCFILLAMRFDTKRAREWQGQFLAAFNAMEQQIITVSQNREDDQWVSARQTGKIGRKQQTDVIKEFVDYATAQGSKSAQYYYKHITNATYRALGLMSQRNPKLRDALSIYEVAELLLAERLAMNGLKQYMELGRHYKDIYECVKDDLMEFGEKLSFGRKAKAITEK